MTRRGIALLAAVALAFGATAQQHPNQEKGFDPSKLYHFSDLDSVNTFNGNLIVTLPLTQTFRVGPLLAYSFTPVYNANVWDAQSFDPSLLQLKPCSRCNAGLGWTLSLGRLVPPSDPTNSLNDANHGYLYESPDGRDHAFTAAAVNTRTPYYLYSKDESGLRMQVTDSVKTIEFPDGTKRKFSDHGDDNWKLDEIFDPFGNHVYIDYSRSTTSHEIWDITEKQQTTTIRSHTVEFNVTADNSYAGDHTNGTTFPQTYLTRVTVAAVDGHFAEYDFNYTLATVPIPPDDTMDPTGSNVIHEFLLTGIDLITKDANGTALTSPLLGSYSMAQPGGYQLCAANSRCSDSGLLQRLRLPTGGTYAWTYAETEYPPPARVVQDPNYSPVPLMEHRKKMIGVSKRTLTDFPSNHSSTWYYSYVPGHYQQCVDTNNVQWNFWHQTSNAVTAPDGTTTVSYYAIYQGDPCNAGNDDNFVAGEYGYPFTHWADDGSGLLLSTETYAAAPPTTDGPSFLVPQKTSPHLVPRCQTCSPPRDEPETLRRTKRIVYETLGVLGGSSFSASTERTYYNDDDLSGQFTETIKRGQDNAGHYKQVSAGGTINGTTTYRTTFTNYPTIPPPTLNGISSWLFNRYTEQCSRVEGSARQTAVDSCSTLAGGTPAAATKDFNQKQFCFDDSTGFLLRQRAVRTTTPDAGDLVAVFTPSSTGEVASESYYGGEIGITGDQIPMTPTNWCSADFGTAGYTINREYFAGTLKKSTYAGALFNSVDSDIDENTGLVRFDRDSAGVQTEYQYDLAGRLTAIIPSGVQKTDYAYSNAVLSGTGTSASASSTQTSTSADEGGRHSEFVFDGFGHVLRQLSRTATGGLRGSDTEYDELGRKKSETTPADFDSSYPPANKTTTTYDFSGRPTTITAPDLATTTFTYHGIRKIEREVKIATAVSLADSSTTTETYDALGRLTQVDQPFSASAGDKVTAAYSYDSADRLTNADMNTVQHRVFDYDNRGFLKSETHPEIGVNGGDTITYQGYDPRGHAHRKITGPQYGPFDLSFEFDAAERLTSVARQTSASTKDTIKTFTYGDIMSPAPTNSKGKIVAASRYNYVDSLAKNVRVDEEYHYTGPGGRLADSATTVTIGSTVVQSFSQSYTYSSLGDLATVTYPSFSGSNAPARTVTNLNKYGFLVGVSGYAGGYDSAGHIQAGITYSPSGLVATVMHADGTLDTYSPDSHGMARPGHIRFDDFSDCTMPSAPAISTAATACPSSTNNTASVPEAPSITAYSWLIAGGTITSGQTGSTVTFTADSSGTVHLTATVTTDCGTSTPATADVTITTTPTAPNISAPSDVCPNSTGNTASVPPNANLTYAWSASGGTITSGASSPTVTFSVGSSGNVNLSLTVTNSCGGHASTSHPVPIATPPAQPTITAPATVASNSTGNIASVPQDASLTYAWSIIGGSISSGASTSAITFTAGASGTIHLTVTVTNHCALTSSKSVDVQIAPPTSAPNSVDAHAVSSSAINVSWSPVNNATEYRVVRAATKGDDLNGIYHEVVNHFIGTNIQDAVTPNTGYIYRVQAYGPGGLSALSVMDIATSVIIDPAPRIQADDWTKMRRAVRALCIVAQVDLPTQCSFTDVQIDGIAMPSGTSIKLVHLTELRRGLDASRTQLGLSALRYQEPSPQARVTLVRLKQVSEISDGVR